jgi:2-iminobutanoate/2-iminopropanoate deaminase
MSQRTKIATQDAPQAIGPYSQAIVHGGLVYCSGQIALDPKTMQMVGGHVAEQAEQVLKNLGAVLRAAGSDYSEVLRCTVYLRDMADFAAVNAVYAKYFSGDMPPARATVAAAGLPKDALVEIDCIARVAK